MPILTLTSLWMAPVSALSDTLSLPISSESESTDSPAQVRRYAGGRDRLISTPGGSITMSVTARNVTRTVYQELQSRVGVLQLFREPRGRSYAGVIQSVSADEWQYPESPVGDVSFSYTSVSYSEIV